MRTFFIIDCTNRTVNLFFDRIHTGPANDEKFDDVKPLLHSFIAGGTSIILNHGTTGSGKSCTLFGFHSIGILGRSFEFIINATNSKVFATAIEIVERGCLDMCDKKALLEENIKPKEKVISSMIEFESFIDGIKLTRVQKQTNENPTSSRSHLLIVLSLDGGASKSNLVFVDLAGFESPDNKGNGQESKFINSSLSDINSLLINMKKQNVYNPPKTNKIAVRLKSFLTPTSQTLMLYHVNDKSLKKGLEYIKEIASSTRKSKRPNSGLSDITNKISRK